MMLLDTRDLSFSVIAVFYYFFYGLDTALLYIIDVAFLGLVVVYYV
jgi:hypothetical protein